MTRKKFVTLWPFLFGAFAAGVMMWSAHLVSPSHWLDVRSVRVFDGRVGQPVASHSLMNMLVMVPSSFSHWSRICDFGTHTSVPPL